MDRRIWIGLALLGAVSLTPGTAPAQTRKIDRSDAALQRLMKRLPRRSLAFGPSTQSHASRTPTVGLEMTDGVFVDNDGSGDDLTFGDTFILYGPMFNSAGTDVGTWEGTITLTTDDNILGIVNLALRFDGQGTVVINGSPYPDGARMRDADGYQVPMAPIAGATGRMTYVKGQAGLAYDADSELIVAALGAR